MTTQPQQIDPSVTRNQIKTTAAAAKSSSRHNIQDIFTELKGENTASSLPPILEEVKDKQTLEEELKLIEVCQDIGAIAERNNHYTLSLTYTSKSP